MAPFTASQIELHAPSSHNAALSSLEKPEPLQPIRVRGGVEIGLDRRPCGSTFARVRRESDGYKLRLPNRGDACEVAVINTGGGIASGDEVAIRVSASAGVDAVITSPSAERVYAAAGVLPARYAVKMEVAGGARLEWLPQETILFDRSRFERTLDIHCALDASVLIGEIVVFGRTARNEELHDANFEDRWQIRRGERLAHVEAVVLSGEVASQLDRNAIAAGARAIGTLVLVAPDADTKLGLTRDQLQSAPGSNYAGASAQPGKLVVRVLGRNGHAVRRCFEHLLPKLTGRGLPRVWNC